MAGHQTLNSIYVVRLLTREPHHRKQLRRRDPQHRARGDQQLRLRVQDGAQVAFLQRVMGLAVGWPVPESLVVCDLDGKVVGGRPAPVFRHANACCHLPRLGRPCWRCGARALQRHRHLGAGGTFDPVLRDHAGRLLPRRGALHAEAHRGGNLGGLRAQR